MIACHDDSRLLFLLSKNAVASPAFIYDENALLHSLRYLGDVRSSSGCNILFSLKSFTIYDALIQMAPLVNGFSVSSLFEAKIAHDILGDDKSVHLISPGLRIDEFDAVADICDYISFNSLPQWNRFRRKVGGRTSCGIRINPKKPFVKDDRYNPCRKYSKLGIDIDQLAEAITCGSNILDRIKGIHFHTNTDSLDLLELSATVEYISKRLSKMLNRLDWINLGGGYLFDEADNLDAFSQTVSFLRSKCNLEVFIEPGAFIVRKAGYLVSSVVDIFMSDDRTIVVLDTTVNHMPEVFEYQFEPDVVGHAPNGQYEYVLAGCTCLAGDIFGEYAFNEPLEIGSRVIFSNAGAYTLVKAHMFNGVNLPSIYAYTTDGKLELKKQFSYEDFLSRCGGNKYAPL